MSYKFRTDDRIGFDLDLLALARAALADDSHVKACEKAFTEANPDGDTLNTGIASARAFAEWSKTARQREPILAQGYINMAITMDDIAESEAFWKSKTFKARHEAEQLRVTIVKLKELLVEARPYVVAYEAANEHDYGVQQNLYERMCSQGYPAYQD